MCLILFDNFISSKKRVIELLYKIHIQTRKQFFNDCKCLLAYLRIISSSNLGNFKCRDILKIIILYIFDLIYFRSTHSTDGISYLTYFETKTKTETSPQSHFCQYLISIKYKFLSQIINQLTIYNFNYPMHILDYAVSIQKTNRPCRKLYRFRKK